MVFTQYTTTHEEYTLCNGDPMKNSCVLLNVMLICCVYHAEGKNDREAISSDRS